MRGEWRSGWTLFVIVALLASLIGTYLSWRACDGRLVRGLVWWECVK